MCLHVYGIIKSSVRLYILIYEFIKNVYLLRVVLHLHLPFFLWFRCTTDLQSAATSGIWDQLYHSLTSKYVL
jgi:hypothetical protein